MSYYVTYSISPMDWAGTVPRRPHVIGTSEARLRPQRRPWPPCPRTWGRRHGPGPGPWHGHM